MATTLLEMTQQGDPGTPATEEQARKIQLLDPQQLYLLWERQHWLSQDIDFSRTSERLGRSSPTRSATGRSGGWRPSSSARSG